MCAIIASAILALQCIKSKKTWRKLSCLIPLILAVGIGALLYIMIKDEVQLAEMFLRFIRWGYIDTEWNGFEDAWLQRMFQFTDIRKWGV